MYKGNKKAHRMKGGGIYDKCKGYITINKALFGDAMLLGFHEGNFGTISRIFNVIERNVSDGLKKDDYKATWEILDNTSMPPEDRAKRLLGE